MVLMLHRTRRFYPSSSIASSLLIVYPTPKNILFSILLFYLFLLFI